MSLHQRIRDARLAAWLRKARRLLDAGEYESAHSWAQAVMEVDATCEGAHALMTNIRRVAVERLSQQTGQGAALAQDLMRLAQWLLEDERYEEAAARIEEARTQAAGVKLKDEEAAELRQLQGRAAYHQGRYDAALEHLAAARANPALHAENWYYTGLCHEARGERMAAVRWFAPLARKHQWAIEARLGELVEARENGSRQ